MRSLQTMQTKSIISKISTLKVLITSQKRKLFHFPPCYETESSNQKKKILFELTLSSVDRAEPHKTHSLAPSDGASQPLDC